MITEQTIINNKQINVAVTSKGIDMRTASDTIQQIQVFTSVTHIIYT